MRASSKGASPRSARKVRHEESLRLAVSSRTRLVALSPAAGRTKLGDVSRQTSQLLEAFDALPKEEQRAFTAAFLRRVIPFDSGPLDDEETARAADEVFRLLDAEESDDASSR